MKYCSPTLVFFENDGNIDGKWLYYSYFEGQKETISHSLILDD